MKIGDLLTSDFFKVFSYDAVSSIERDLLLEKYCVVFDKKKNYVGLLTIEDVVERPHKLVVDCIRDKSHLSFFDDPQDVFFKMIQDSTIALPVFKEKQFCGVLTKKGLLEYYNKKYSNLNYCYRQICSLVSDLVIIFNPQNGLILECNKSAGAVFKILTESDTGVTVQELLKVDLHFNEMNQLCLDEPGDIVIDYNKQKYIIQPDFVNTIDRNLAYMVLQQYTEDQTINKSNSFEAATSMYSSHFLSKVSHELRTPINGIMGMANLLKNEKMSRDGKKYIEMLINSANNLYELVNDLIDVEQLERGLFKLQKVKIDINEFIDSNLGLFNIIIKQKGVRFSVNIDPGLTYAVIGDSLRLRQVLLNLVTNSVKNTDRGVISLSVSEVQKNTEKAVLRFVVADTGKGIAVKKIPYIFDPFYQGEEGSLGQNSGLGLGLTIVKNLVDMMQGTIHVNSEPGKGSSFMVQIPFELFSNDMDDTVNKKLEDANLRCQNDIKILVAEDEAINSLYLATLLRKKGYCVTTVNSGKGVLRELEKETFDVLLMDISMPEMDGYTATHFIRTKMKSSIPVIALTAHAYENDRKKCLESGMNDYISKPINEYQLLKTINKYLV